MNQTLRFQCVSLQVSTANNVKPLSDELINSIKESLRQNCEGIDIEAMADVSNT